MKSRYVNHVAVTIGLSLIVAVAFASPALGQTSKGNTSQPARTAFQARAFVGPTGEGNQTSFLTIPAGKRLVIENISAIARRPPGLQMEITLFSYLDNGDGVGDSNDITFHRIPLTEQGTFAGTAISSANLRVLVFADEQIGTGHFQVGVQGRLNGSAAGGFVQGQVTISGYLEDLPDVP